MEEGKIVVDKKVYTILSMIGKGGAGEVYMVQNAQNEFFAIKIVRNYDHPVIKQSVDKQIKIQKSFKGNQHVIQCFAVEASKKKVSIVMELGEFSLRNQIDMKQVSQREILVVLSDLCEGLSSIHQKKIIHRDIKPQNIIHKNGIYKITDFGVSSEIQFDDSMTGTLPYWAPEIIFQKDKVFNNKVDVWSLGVSVFECYFKVNPFFIEKLANSFQNAKQQIKKNIQQLTNDFSIKKVVQFLKENDKKEQSRYLDKKASKTDPKIIQALCLFFEPDPKKRNDIQYFKTIFTNLKKQYEIPKHKKTQINRKYQWNSIAPEILLFCKAKDLFYQIESTTHKTSKYYDRVIFGLQLGIWFLQGRIYNGEHVIFLDKINHLKKYSRSPQKLWEQVLSLLSEYFFHLRFDEFLQNFDRIAELKIRILVCSAFKRIYEDPQSFVKIVNQINSNYQLDTHNYLEVFNFLQDKQQYSIKELKNLQHLLVLEYYC